MNFEELPEFTKDLKTLLKKYRTLNEDLAVVKKVLSVSSDERPPFSRKLKQYSTSIRLILSLSKPKPKSKHLSKCVYGGLIGTD